jgi:hypothetical protein
MRVTGHGAQALQAPRVQHKDLLDYGFPQKRKTSSADFCKSVKT